MLNIYYEALEVAGEVAKLACHIDRRDADLARQLRRAMTSVPLNLAEGVGSTGGNRRLRYSTALGSALEVTACLDVAVAMGYLGDIEPSLADKLDKLQRTANRLSRKR